MEACQWNLQRICGSLDDYALAHQGIYPWSGDLAGFLSDRLETTILCPAVNLATYRIEFEHFVPSSEEALGSRYTLWCSGLNHSEAAYPLDYPRTKGFGHPVEP